MLVIFDTGGLSKLRLAIITPGIAKVLELRVLAGFEDPAPRADRRDDQILANIIRAAADCNGVQGCRLLVA